MKGNFRLLKGTTKLQKGTLGYKRELWVTVFLLSGNLDLYTRDGRYQLFQIDTIPIRYQGFLVVSIPNFDTDTIKFERLAMHGL